MPRVLMLAYHYAPSTAAGSFRTIRFVKHLPTHGWEPIVISIKERHCSNLLDYSLIDHARSNGRILRTSVLQAGVPYRALLVLVKRALRRQGRVFAPERDGLSMESGKSRKRIRDVLGELVLAYDEDLAWAPFGFAAGLWAVRRYRPSVLYSTGGPFSSHVAGLAVRRATRLPWVADFRDPWSANRIRECWHPKVQKLGRLLEGAVVNAADAVVANTEVLAQTLQRWLGPDAAQKIVVIPNGFDPEEFEDVPRISYDRFTIVYVGAAYPLHSPVPFFAALQLVLDARPDRRDRIQVLFVGAGEDEYGPISRGMGLGDVVHFLGPRAHREALSIMRSAHVLLLTLTTSEVESPFIPGKVYEYMASGVPLLAITEKGALWELLARHGVRHVYQPGDVTGIARAIRSLCMADANGGSLGGRPAPEEHSSAARTARLVDVFEKVLAPPATSRLR